MTRSMPLTERGLRSLARRRADAVSRLGVSSVVPSSSFSFLLPAFCFPALRGRQILFSGKVAILCDSLAILCDSFCVIRPLRRFLKKPVLGWSASRVLNVECRVLKGIQLMETKTDCWCVNNIFQRNFARRGASFRCVARAFVSFSAPPNRPNKPVLSSDS